MTKTEEIGMESLPWKKVLTELTLKNEVPYTVRELIRLAKYWGTCPCGAQDASIERNDGEPKDEVLKYLGTQFPSYVMFQDWHGALNICNMIEHRARELIREKKIKEREAYRNPYEGLRPVNTVIVDHASMMRPQGCYISPEMRQAANQLLLRDSREIEIELEEPVQEAEVLEDSVLETEEIT